MAMCSGPDKYMRELIGVGYTIHMCACVLGRDVPKTVQRGALGEGWLSYRCTASLAVAQLVKVLSEYIAKGLGLSQSTVAEWGCSAL